MVDECVGLELLQFFSKLRKHHDLWKKLLREYELVLNEVIELTKLQLNKCSSSNPWLNGTDLSKYTSQKLKESMADETGELNKALDKLDDVYTVLVTFIGLCFWFDPVPLVQTEPPVSTYGKTRAFFLKSMWNKSRVVEYVDCGGTPSRTLYQRVSTALHTKPLSEIDSVFLLLDKQPFIATRIQERLAEQIESVQSLLCEMNAMVDNDGRGGDPFIRYVLDRIDTAICSYKVLGPID